MLGNHLTHHISLWLAQTAAAAHFEQRVKVSIARLEIGLLNPNRLLKSMFAHRLFVARKASKVKILRARDTRENTQQRETFRPIQTNLKNVART